MILHAKCSFVLSMLLATALGCDRGPAPVRPPRIDAKRASLEAMKRYDSDGDGFLSGSELDQASGVKAAMATVDTDQDGKVTAAEIEARIKSWQESRAGISSILCYVTLDGESLMDATVTFEPEPFLGSEIQTAVGITNSAGAVAPAIPLERRPTPDTPEGLQLGFYKIRISKLKNGKELLPGRYNTETILGQQVANDDSAIARHRVDIALQSH